MQCNIHAGASAGADCKIVMGLMRCSETLDDTLIINQSRQVWLIWTHAANVTFTS